MQTITLKTGKSVRIVIEGAGAVLVEHVTDADNGHAIQLHGDNCDLQGEMPGLYYPTPLTVPAS